MAIPRSTRKVFFRSTRKKTLDQINSISLQHIFTSNKGSEIKDLVDTKNSDGSTHQKLNQKDIDSLFPIYTELGGAHEVNFFPVQYNRKTQL